MHNMPDEQLLTVYEAAAQARVHHTTIRRAIKAREIEYIQTQPNAPIKIPQPALRAWLAKNTKRALAKKARYGSRAVRRAAEAAAPIAGAETPAA